MNELPNESPTYDNETVLLKTIHEEFIKTTKTHLEQNYIPQFLDAKQWQCFGDYAFDDKKQNHVITFTLFPYIMDFNLIMTGIKNLVPKEIKHTKSVNHNFIDFIKISPFINFSFILQNHNNLFLSDKEGLKNAMLISLKRILHQYIPNWTTNRPQLQEYHKSIAKKIRQVIQLIEQGQKIRILKNLFLITTIGSYLCTQIANKTNAEKFGWFSDRDDINDIADNFSIDLFNILFAEHLINQNCQFFAAPANSRSTEWYSEFIKIPDFITGTLADYNLSNGEVTHNKFIPLIRDLIADNDRNIFVFKLNFNNDNSISCSRLNFKKDTSPNDVDAPISH